MVNPGRPVQVLMVEDNDPDVFLVEEALRSHGILAQIQRCQDGEEAIQVLSQMGEARLPHIIIIDLSLPKVTGLEILKYIRSLTQFDGVPVLILTSSQSMTDRALGKKFGADTYIAKPPTLAEFLSAVGSGIRALLERPEGGAPRSWLRCMRPRHRMQIRFRPSKLVKPGAGGRVRIISAV